MLCKWLAPFFFSKAVVCVLVSQEVGALWLHCRTLFLMVWITPSSLLLAWFYSTTKVYHSLKLDKLGHVLSMADIYERAYFTFVQVWLYCRYVLGWVYLSFSDKLAWHLKLIGQVFQKCNWDKLSSPQLLDPAISGPS
jgi:hypothetical protein